MGQACSRGKGPSKKAVAERARKVEVLSLLDFLELVCRALAHLHQRCEASRVIGRYSRRGLLAQPGGACAGALLPPSAPPASMLACLLAVGGLTNRPPGAGVTA